MMNHFNLYGISHGLITFSVDDQLKQQRERKINLYGISHALITFSVDDQLKQQRERKICR
jgi:hypothetical protein